MLRRWGNNEEMNMRYRMFVFDYYNTKKVSIKKNIMPAYYEDDIHMAKKFFNNYIEKHKPRCAYLIGDIGTPNHVFGIKYIPTYFTMTDGLPWVPIKIYTEDSRAAFLLYNELGFVNDAKIEYFTTDKNELHTFKSNIINTVDEYYTLRDRDKVINVNLYIMTKYKSYKFVMSDGKYSDYAHLKLNHFKRYKLKG